MLLAIDNAASVVWVLAHLAGRHVVERYGQHGLEWSDESYASLSLAWSVAESMAGQRLHFFDV